MSIRVVTFIVVVGTAAGVYGQAPAASVEEVKAKGTIALFESPELAGQCALEIEREKATIKAWEDYRRERDALNLQREPGKPTKDMTATERAEWQARKAAAEQAIAELEAKNPHFADGGLMHMAKATSAKNATCGEATMMQLSEGTALTILKREKMLRVRVETGRAAGRIGFVFPEDVKKETAEKK